MEIKPYNFSSFENKKSRLPSAAGRNTNFTSLPITGSGHHEQLASEDVPEHIKEAMEAGRKKGVEEGIIKGKQERFELDQKILSILSAIEKKITSFSDNITSIRNTATTDSIKLASLVAKKVAGEALGENAQKNIEDFIKKSIDLATNEPELSITVHESFCDEIKKKIEEINKEKNRKINVIGGGAIKEGDCVIEWKDGGAMLSSDDKWKKIDELLFPGITSKANDKTVAESVEKTGKDG